MGHNTQVRSVALVFLIIACWSSIPTASATLFPAINTLANEARDAVGAFGSLLNAIVLDPVRLATGSIQVLPRSIERFFDLPAISLASQRINDVTIDLTQLQVYAEDVLGIDNSCKPADYRAASRQPALIEGPTLSVTFNTVNCSIDGTDIGLLIDKHDKSKDIHINKTFACDKGLIEFEKVGEETCYTMPHPHPLPHTPPSPHTDPIHPGQVISPCRALSMCRVCHQQGVW